MLDDASQKWIPSCNRCQTKAQPFPLAHLSSGWSKQVGSLSTLIQPLSSQPILWPCLRLKPVEPFDPSLTCLHRKRWTDVKLDWHPEAHVLETKSIPKDDWVLLGFPPRLPAETAKERDQMSVLAVPPSFFLNLPPSDTKRDDPRSPKSDPLDIFQREWVFVPRLVCCSRCPIDDGEVRSTRSIVHCVWICASELQNEGPFLRRCKAWVRKRRGVGWTKKRTETLRWQIVIAAKEDMASPSVQGGACSFFCRRQLSLKRIKR